MRLDHLLSTENSFGAGMAPFVGMVPMPAVVGRLPSLAGVEMIRGVAALSGRYGWYGVLLGSRTATPGVCLVRVRRPHAGRLGCVSWRLACGGRWFENWIVDASDLLVLGGLLAVISQDMVSVWASCFVFDSERFCFFWFRSIVFCSDL